MGNFPGFSVPEGAWLPPELLDILPEIDTLSELKVIIAAISETLRFGMDSAVISLTDFEALTGLGRKSVSRGIESALERGTMEREPAGGSYLYRLHFIRPHSPAGRGTMPLVDAVTAPQGRGTMPLVGRGEMPPNRGTAPPNGGEMPPNRGTAPPHVVMHVTSPTLPEDIHTKQRGALVAEMRQLGVALKVAQNLVGKYDAGYLLEKLQQARFAIEQGLADHGPGWFVASVKEGWQAPMGYYDEKVPAPGSKESRYRYIEGKYADLIEH